MAGITTPFTTPTFPFLQTVSSGPWIRSIPAFLLRNGPTRRADSADAGAGLGQGVFAVNATLGSGYAQQWNVAVQRQLTPNMTLEVAYVGSRITNVGIPDSNLNQLTVEQLAQGQALLQQRAQSIFRHHSAVVVAGRSDDHAWRSS